MNILLTYCDLHVRRFGPLSKMTSYALKELTSLSIYGVLRTTFGF